MPAGPMGTAPPIAGSIMTNCVSGPYGAVPYNTPSPGKVCSHPAGSCSRTTYPPGARFANSYSPLASVVVLGSP